MAYENLQALVSTDWLADHLNDENLRVFDCTVMMGEDAPSAREAYESAHIAGASFLDLYNDLSDHSKVPFMMPDNEKVREVLAQAGISNDSQVILYSTTTVMWATRVWWMLRSLGLENVAVLDGGFAKWQAENRPVASGAESYPAGELTIAPVPERWADKAQVRAEIENGGTCIVHALSAKQFNSKDDTSYGRPGRIKNSQNVPHANLLTENGTFKPTDDLRDIFTEAGILEKEQVIAYCGGGISATMVALGLHLVNYDKVAIYDGSLSEWGRNETLPMDVG
ncbi:MAG: sulfurtransferase [Chloroflexota bacterium]